MVATTLSIAVWLTALTLAQNESTLAQNQAEPTVIPARKHGGGNAESVAISGDGQFVAAGFGGPSSGRFPLTPRGGGVCVWQRTTGEQVFSRGEYGDVIRIGFSRDGRHLAYSRIYTPGDSIDLDTTVLIDLGSKEVVKRWRSAAFAFSPVDDLMLVSAGRGTAVVDLKTLEVERTVAVPGARAFACSADGKTIAALCYHWSNRAGTPDGLAVFAPDDEKPRFIQKDDSLRSANAIALSPDGQQAVTGHVGGVAKIWSAKEQAEPRQANLETELCVFPLFARRGQTLVLATQPAGGVSWSYDRDDPSGFKFTKGKPPPWSDLHQFDFPTGKPEAVWRFEDASFRTYYARFGSSRHYPEYNPARFAVSADGKILVGGAGGCCTVEMATGKLIRTFSRSRAEEGGR